MGVFSGAVVLIVGIILLVFPGIVMKILRPKTSIYTINPAPGYKKGFQKPRPPANEVYGESATSFFRVMGIILIIVSFFLFLN